MKGCSHTLSWKAGFQCSCAAAAAAADSRSGAAGTAAAAGGGGHKRSPWAFQ